ncbi:MAG: DUF559 domain-containing protein [Actinocatenispora sp.]
MTSLDESARRQHGHLSHREIRQQVTQHTFRRQRLRGNYQSSGIRVVRLAGCPPSEVGRCHSAVLSVGQPAMIGGVSAARLHGVGRFDEPTRTWLVVPATRYPCARSEVRLRRTRTWDRRVAVTLHGLAVSSLVDTILDLAPHHPLNVLTAATEDAVRAGLDLFSLLDRVGRGTPGGRAVKIVVARLQVSAVSMLERLLAPALRRAGLGYFRQNVVLRSGTGDRIGEVDLLYEAERVAVELDGWSYHHDRVAFQRDRAKQNRLTGELGITVLRFTHADLVERLPSVVSQIGAVLAARRPRSVQRHAD